jgi:hypothetical protein
MATISLKLLEFYQLDSELNGVVNQSTGEQLSTGLLSENLKLTTKYWLTELAKKITVEKQAIESLKDELIKKYGEVNESGGYSISLYLTEGDEQTENTVNPKFMEFQNEFKMLLNEEKELEYKPFPLSSFEDLKSDNNYPVFFKLVTEDEQN